MTRVGGMDRVRCPVCGRWQGVRHDGVVGQHGPVEDRCPGSGRPAADGSPTRRHCSVPVRPIRVSSVLAGLVGTGCGVGRGNSFGQAVAIDSIRAAELLGRVPAVQRLPRQPREVAR